MSDTSKFMGYVVTGVTDAQTSKLMAYAVTQDNLSITTAVSKVMAYVVVDDGSTSPSTRNKGGMLVFF